MKNLIGMTDFVLHQDELIHKCDNKAFAKSILKYANFLKQPLELWMFIPCDECGNVLEDPKDEDLCKYCSYDESKRGASAFSSGCEGSRCDSAADYFMEIFEQAKERCLFEGIFSISKKKDYYIVYLDESAIYVSWNKSKIIENLVAYDLQLTSTAIKQLQS